MVMMLIYVRALTLLALLQVGCGLPVKPSPETTTAEGPTEADDLQPVQGEEGEESAERASRNSGHAWGASADNPSSDKQNATRMLRREQLFRKHLISILLRYIRHYAVQPPDDLVPPGGNHVTSPTTTAPQQTDDQSPYGWRDSPQQPGLVAKWNAIFSGMSTEQIVAVVERIMGAEAAANVLQLLSPHSGGSSGSSGHGGDGGWAGISDVCCLIG